MLRCKMQVFFFGKMFHAVGPWFHNDLTFWIISMAECRQHLCEPDHRMIHPCSKLLVAIATASYPACIAVLRYAIPILLDQMDIFQEVRYYTVCPIKKETHFANISQHKLFLQRLTCINHCTLQVLFFHVIPNVLWMDYGLWITSRQTVPIFISMLVSTRILNTYM